MDNISFLLVGCDEYENMQNLSNVKTDLDRYKDVFSRFEYSLYDEKKFTEVYNKSSYDFRMAIQEYVFKRSAEQDILFLIFCGHGTAIGRDDFGFCMSDAVVHTEDNVILPTSVVKLSEIIGTLNIKNVSLVLIVDACYSGQIGKQYSVPFTELSLEISRNLVAYNGNSFAYISSCSNIEQVKDIGVISQALLDICDQGLSENEDTIKLAYLAESLPEGIYSHALVDTRARVFIPPGKISNIQICQNVQYVKPKEPINTYSFTKPYLYLMEVLWNSGNPISLSPGEILEKTGSQSAYANHNKLSLPCWELLKTDKNGKRKLTKKGIDFISGQVPIPKVIIENKETRECIPYEDGAVIIVIERKNDAGVIIKDFQEIE